MDLFFCIVICIKCVQVLSNYTFYEITAFNAHERNLLYYILVTTEYSHFLNGITNEASTLIDVIVDSCCTEDFEQTLAKYDIEYSRVRNNVPISLNDRSNTENLQQHEVSQRFLNWEEILLWVENKIKENSALTKTVIAKTYEHRDLFVLIVSAEKKKNKKAVFIVAGEEGRDWLSSALLLNYVNKILETTSSPDSLLNYYDFYFIPIFNPDGFAYTKQKDRMWAKNRRLLHPKQRCGKNEPAVGVNIDKNWFIKNGDSKYACNSIYRGSKALSEEETQGLSYILNSIALKLLAFVNLRGFGNLITLPYSNNKEVSTNHNILMEIMKHTSAILKMQYKKSYPVGTTSNYFYNFSGNMPDWVKKKLNIPVVFTVYMQYDKFLPQEFHILPLTEQLESLLNVSLVISKEIYGSLYNSQGKNSPAIILILIGLICAYIKGLF